MTRKLLPLFVSVLFSSMLRIYNCKIHIKIISNLSIGLNFCCPLNCGYFRSSEKQLQA